MLDAARDGAILSAIDAGDGVDDLEFAASGRTLYVAGAKSATLTVAHVDEKGTAKVSTVVATKEGARNAIIDEAGRVYLTHSRGSELLVVAKAGSPAAPM